MASSSGSPSPFGHFVAHIANDENPFGHFADESAPASQENLFGHFVAHIPNGDEDAPMLDVAADPFQCGIEQEPGGNEIADDAPVPRNEDVEVAPLDADKEAAALANHFGSAVC